ncbi:hypothetical protein EGT36_01870 [Agrobacterium sp. FDAARGOS_525]|nr:hypothetical protein EGT36_01870 [Agrobacterium sp. FDAARGOS_525]
MLRGSINSRHGSFPTLLANISGRAICGPIAENLLLRHVALRLGGKLGAFPPRLIRQGRGDMDRPHDRWR